jgi:hypothetical protein
MGLGRQQGSPGAADRMQGPSGAHDDTLFRLVSFAKLLVYI